MSKIITIQDLTEIDWAPAFKYQDDILRHNDPKKYIQKWQTRCKDCLAPCCYFPMKGYIFDYKKEEEDLTPMQDFFTWDFVLMKIRFLSPEEQKEMGFNIDNDPIELDEKKGLQICPLNVLGNCLIYDNSPKMCKSWRCQLKINRRN